MVSSEIQVRVQVTNLDDNPPRFGRPFYPLSVEQFTLPDTTLLNVTASDPDMLGNVTFALRGADSMSFRIGNTTGELSTTIE